MTKPYELKTKRGYDFYEVASAMQKAIRRGDAKIAGYFGIELYESGYHKFLWARLLIISAEDCFGIITKEIQALRQAFDFVHSPKDADKLKARIFVSKAIVLMALAAHSRDADHLGWFVYDQKGVNEQTIEKALQESDASREGMEAIPDYAFDCHTRQGRMMGRTKAQFWPTEHMALANRQIGFFDSNVV